MSIYSIRLLFKELPRLQGKFLACRRITTTMPTRQELEQMIRIEPVTFNLPCGEEVTVESHIQDTLASGSDIGTVVCLHGSPGSYKDFKYITPHLHEKGIRVIGVNFPDYGLTAGHEKLGFCNAERNNYIKAVLDQVGVKDNLIVMGHSRGCENATGTAALLSDRLSGLVLLNPTGLRLHRGLRPFWLVPFVLWLHSINFIQNAIENFLYWFYNKIGLRLDSGRRAIACVRTMFHIELDKLKPKIDVINNTKQAKVLQAYSGKDLFIEPCVSQELAQSWHDHKDLTCKERSPEATERVTESTASYFKSGVKSVSVYFTEEDHFLQKHQPKFVADAIEAMLKA